MTDKGIDESNEEGLGPKSPDEIERAKRAQIVAYEARHAQELGLPRNIVIQHSSHVARGLGAEPGETDTQGKSPTTSGQEPNIVGQK